MAQGQLSPEVNRVLASESGQFIAGRSAADSRGVAFPERLLRQRLQERVREVADQDADLDRERRALAALGRPRVPSDVELQGLDPDPDTCPPQGADRWLGELPEPLRDEYAQVTAGPDNPLDRVIVAEGFTDRRKGVGGGFGAGGVGDTLAPGPALAGLAADAECEGLPRLADDELIGVILAWRRLGARAAAGELAAVAELAARRESEAAASGDPHRAEHVDDEIAAALTLTGHAADRKLELAAGLARLPGAAAALAAGDIDERRTAVLVDEVSALGDDHAAAVERQVLGRAGAQTTGQLRAAVRRAVIAADPTAARRRKEQASREARVEKWDEQRGTAALAGRDLPVADVLAADQHLTSLAGELRAAGLDGSLDQLRAKAFLALLGGQSAAALFPTSVPPCPPDRAVPGSDRPQPASRGPRQDRAGPWAPVPRRPGGAVPAGSVPAGLRQPANPPAAAGSQRAPGAVPRQSAYPGPGTRGSVNLTLPLATWLGVTDAPGHVAGHGPLDADDARDLAARLAARAGNRWCLTITDRDGRAVAHGCAGPGAPFRSPGGRSSGAGSAPSGWAGSGAVRGTSGEAAGTGRAAPGGAGVARGGGTRPAPATSPSGGPRARPAWTFALSPLQAGECAHPRETAAYVVPASLRHLIEIRQSTCCFPGCRRPATRCDLDHTVPYDQGGRTCECDLAPLCRRHHRAKQAHRWRLAQPQPGTLVWTPPSGRTYTTRPTRYPCG